MIKINVILSNLNWKKYLLNPSLYVRKKISIINKKDKYFKKKKIICTLLLSENDEIKKLNKKFRNKNTTTDVLSFPSFEKNEINKKLRNKEEVYLGDIIVNLKKIKHKNKKNNFKLEFDKIWIHGLVHLLGYDHKKNKDFRNMLKIEKRLLSYLY